MNPILIVDDEAAIAMLVRRILTEAGYRCQAVTDSRAAANLLEKNRYDLVLLDVMMPHLDGYDLLAYLRPTGTICWRTCGPRARPASSSRRRTLWPSGCAG